MGTNPAPPFADIFMAKIDKKMEQLIETLKETQNISVECLNRFLDDLFSIFIGTTKQLHKLWEMMNKIHPSVEFTMLCTPPLKTKELKTIASVNDLVLYHIYTRPAA